MVMDRLFLWIFTVAVLVGTVGIILQVQWGFNYILRIMVIDFHCSCIFVGTFDIILKVSYQLVAIW
jgi:hypothetical protein